MRWLEASAASSDPAVMRDLGMTGEPVGAPAAMLPCEMYADHGSARPSVTQGHHLFPVYLQNRVWGRIVDGTLVFLCGTCHDNVHAWIYWLMGERKQPDPEPPPRAQRMARDTMHRFLTENASAEKVAHLLLLSEQG